MALRKIQCEFQKPVYVSMIVLTIIVLLFIINSRILAKSLEPKAAPVPLVGQLSAGAAFAMPLTSQMRYHPVVVDSC